MNKLYVYNCCIYSYGLFFLPFVKTFVNILYWSYLRPTPFDIIERVLAKNVVLDSTAVGWYWNFSALLL